MILQRNLSNTMRALRASRKQSIAEFSEEIGISRSAMQDILKGDCNPSLNTIQYIADNLKVDPLTLIASPYSESQLEYMTLVLTLVAPFSNFSDASRREAAKLLHDLVLFADPHK